MPPRNGLEAQDVTRHRSIKDSKPRFDDDGKKAGYALEKPVGTRKVIVFVLVDKLWYLEN
jgi:hypothetical protein